MDKRLSFLGIGVLLVLIACNGQNEKKSDHQDKLAKESTVEKTYYYTCPMDDHKHIHSDKPGDCSECGTEARIYGGRYFAKFDRDASRGIVAADREWRQRCDTDLSEYWPREEIPYTYMTHHANFALPKQGYTHWWKMFNSRQLLVHAEIAKFIRSHLLSSSFAQIEHYPASVAK